MFTESENLGACEECGEDVVYRDGMTSADPQHPMHEFYDGADHLYHWGCHAPHLFPALRNTQHVY